DGNANDIYVYGRDTFILLYGDVSVPIILQGPPSYVFYEKSDHSHDDAEILEFADYSWQSKAQKASPQDFTQGDLTGDGTADLLIRGRGQYDTALLVNGKLVQDGADLVPAYLGDIDSDGRIYTRGKGWSASPVVNGNLSDRNQAISLAGGKLSVAGKFYVYNASSTLVPDAGTAAATSNVPAPPAPIYAQPTLNAQDQQTMDSLGILSGQFKVNESGAATYNLPLKLPQGTAGVAPDVSIGYSSQSGDGLLGLGWSLNAGGAISRCRQTLQVDKAALPISWSSVDRYCLNGQRLLLVSGNYGMADSQYKTEIDTQITVTQKGGSGSADYFEVKAKDGSTSIYGVSGTDSSEEKGYPTSTASCTTVASNGSCADKVMSWNLTQFSDRVGNKIQYVYENGTNTDQKSYRLNSIKYAFANGQSNARIQFNYEEGKKETSLAAGYQFYRDSRLASVETYQTIGGENLLRKYSFNYNGDLTKTFTDERDRLTSIVECSAESCLPPLRLTWGDNLMLYPVTRSVDLKAGFYIDSSFGPNYLDVNGDGRMDFVTLDSSTGDKKYRMRYAVQGADGNFNWGTLTNGATSTSMVSFDISTTGQENFQPHQLRMRTHPVDVNNDGRSDVIVYRKESWGGVTWDLYLATPTPNAFPNDWSLVYKTSAEFPLPFGANGLSNNGNGVQFGDVDSDGLIDAFFTENDRIYVSLLKRDTSSPNVNLPYKYQMPVDRGSAAGVDSFKLIPGGDFNGDGRLDFIGTTRTISSNGSSCSATGIVKVFYQDTQSSFSRVETISSQQSFVNSNSWVPCTAFLAGKETYPENISFADVNADGAVDVVWTLTNADNTFSKFYVNFGDGKGGFAALQTYTLSRGGARNIQFSDRNSNGKIEAIVTYKNERRMYIYEWNNGAFPSSPAEVDPTSTDSGTSTQFFDVNADATLDRVESTVDKVTFYHGEKALTNGLVTSFTTGRGIKTAVQYEPLGTTPNYTKISN
ncbi:MAG TPA: FG-GAP-like repeat-containing protein, partial [Cellvibrionaceae bacterium]|nr:FG-GAP-like repeat-containing protein [Cellvibrionaceae bacterium]